MAQIRLAELVDQVATQLLEAEAAAKQRGGPVMEFSECELELAISIETSGKGGVRVWVLELGGDRKKIDANTIKIKFARLKDRGIAVPAEQAGEGPKLGPPAER